MERRGDLQETTRHTGVATTDVNMFAIKLWMWMRMCGLANSDSFHSKINHISFKSEKASQTSDRYWERIPNFTTLIEYCKLFKISTTVIWSIAIGYSWIITVFLLICMAQAEKHWGQYVVIDVNDCKNYDSIEGRDQRPWKESNFNFNKGLMISSYNRKLSHCILSNNFTGVDKIWIGPDRNTDWITDQNKKFWKIKN